MKEVSMMLRLLTSSMNYTSLGQWNERTDTTSLEKSRWNELPSNNDNCQKLQHMLDVDTAKKHNENIEEQVEIRCVVETLPRRVTGLETFNVE